MTWRVIIAGSREFTDYSRLLCVMDRLLKNAPGDVIILSGCCRGADQLGERYGAARGLGIDSYPADWMRYGKAAGPIRNSQMVSEASHAVVFWNGISRGSGDLIQKAKARGLPLWVIGF